LSKRIEELTDRIIETDFLIVGGGIVGGMAAYRAKRENPDLDVTLIDKAKMEWSGDGVGLDNHNHLPLHKEDFNREITDEDVNNAVFGANRMKGLIDLRLYGRQMKNAYISLPLLEEVGVRVFEDDGTLMVLQAYRRGTNWGPLEYDEYGKPSEPLFGTFSRSSDLKPKLGAAARRKGARVLDRTMLTSIVTRDGEAVGATAINTRTNEFIFIKAKAILLSTGCATRLYPYVSSPYPNNQFYNIQSPVNHGGGQICALNAGAKLYSMEMNNFYNVSKGINHSSGGGACNWYFRMYNSKGESLEDKYADFNVTKAGGKIPGLNYLFAPDMKNAEVLHDVILSPKNNPTNDTQSAVYFTAATEPVKALKFHKLAGGLANELPAECTYVYCGVGMSGGGIHRETIESETGVKNLFAAGYCTGNGGSHGFTWACLIADHVAELTKGKEQAKIDAEQLKQIEETRQTVFAPLGRQGEFTVNPLELESYVKQVMLDYVGLQKVTSKMNRGLELLDRAKGAVPLLTAENPHELMRAIEVQDIIEIAELHTQSSLMRDESRLGQVHYRVEYPEMNHDKWDNMIVTVKKAADEKKYAIEKLNKDI
jgi:succinate dehydrogenase/fumarate reductase flavoprotein subunit